MEVDVQIVIQEAEKAKGQKSTVKSQGSKALISTSIEDDQKINRDDDIGGEGSHDEIRVKEDVVGGVVTPIFEEGVNESSCAEMSETADMSDPPANSSLKYTTGKTVEPSIVSEKYTGHVGEDVLEGDGIDVSQADKIMTERVKSPSDVDLGKNVEPSPVTAKAIGEWMIPSVTNTCAKTAESMERPTVTQGVDNTLDADIQEVTPEDVGQKKKSKKRKHKKMADAGEISEPKKKLSKEERAAKRARKAERKAKRATKKAVEVQAVEDNVPEEAEESIPEEVIPSVTQPAADDEWLPEHESQGGNADEEAQGSD
ncbi:hypothetical protein LIER_11891 [Lithospermum erythrorhizon]|uniref:Uncharacterized protein n=1 Tax=Lithospermum erythrorhizon TaxID=34254 RepID=A0AAV3PR54_LITER